MKLTDAKRTQFFDSLSIPPLRELIIDGKAHPIGALTTTHIRLIIERNERIEARTATTEDRHPCHALVMLLRQGNPNIDFASVAAELKPEHIEAADREALRQFAMHMLVNDTSFTANAAGNA